MIYENNANAAQNERPLALILGVNGGVGSQVSRMLQQRGWRVRAMTRQRTSTGATDGVERVIGDAMNRQDVMDAAKGVSLIVHAVNPSGYRNWESQVLPMLDNTIAAAEASGARIVFPGSVYNFGPDAFPLLTEDSPQKPFTRKGALRVEMERRLKMASMRGVPVLIVRAGDFFGPDARNNWFSQMLVKPGKPVRSVRNPAAPMPGINGPICRMSPRPLAGCWTAQTSFRLSPSITWKVSGISTGCNWLKPSSGLSGIRSGGGSCPGRASNWPLPSFPCSAKCWKCNISGRCRSG